MGITVESSTDTKEALAVLNNPVAEKVEVEEETQETSDDVENTESEESTEVAASDDVDDESDVDTEETTEQNKADKPKKLSGFKRKLVKAHEALSAKDQEIENLRQQLASKREVAEPTRVQTDSKKPVIDDFDTQAEFLEALTDYKLALKDQAIAAEKQQEELKNKVQSKVETYNGRLAEFTKTTKDFKDVIQDHKLEHGKFEFTQNVADLIGDSEVGPQIVYALAKDKKTLDRLNSLDLVSAAKEIAKLEMTLAKPTQKTEVKKTTTAQAPLKTVKTIAAAGKKSLGDPDLSQAEYEQLRREQIKARKGA